MACGLTVPHAATGWQCKSVALLILVPCCCGMGPKARSGAGLGPEGRLSRRISARLISCGDWCRRTAGRRLCLVVVSLAKDVMWGR